MFSVLGVSGATASLCLVAITHTYLLFHCFPYIGYMALTLRHDLVFGNSVTVDSVGWYAGLLGTAFTSGRCLGFVPWKTIRQTLGVKKTLLLSLLLEAICSLWFGLSRTYLSALVARFFLGLSNTLSGCIKRIAIDRERAAAAERVKKEATERASGAGRFSDLLDSKDAPREDLALARVLAFMWWGSALGPVLGGYLSNPGAFSQDTVIPDKIEDQYPFLLPNTVAAILCILSLVAVLGFVQDEETAAQFSSTSASSPPTNSDAAPAGENQPLLLSDKSKDGNSISGGSDSGFMGAVSALGIIWKRENTKLHLLAYWSFSFVVVCIDEALPLFLIARLSGPGLSPIQIGWILSVAGLMVVISQTMALERILSEEEGLGVYPSLRVSSVVGNVPTVLIPVMLVLNGGTYQSLLSIVAAVEPGEEDDVIPGAVIGDSLGQPGILRWQSFLFLALLIGFIRMFCAIYFALIGVATGRTVDPIHRDETARIMTFGALCARAIAPAVAGILVSVFMSSSWPYGGANITLWAVVGLLFGLLAASYTFQLNPPEEVSNNTPLKSDRQSKYLHVRRESEDIFKKLWEGHDNEGSTAVSAKLKRLARTSLSIRHTSSSGIVLDEEAGNINSHTKKRTSWVDHILQPGVNPDEVPFFILGTNKNDKSALPHVLTPPLMEALHRYLPMSCSFDNFWLKYSLVRDGASITTLESKMLMSKNTFIAIETLEGDVFGCFMTKPWHMTHKFELSGESFLWRMKEQRLADQPNLNDEEKLDEIARKEGDVEVFRWTGENDECQLLSRDRIAAGSGMVEGGDGFGFIVQDSLSMGSSSPCLTYANPCLVSSANGRFEVANMEVWAMTPFLFTSEAESSEATIRFIHANTTNARGDALSSAQSAWTNFL